MAYVMFTVPADPNAPITRQASTYAPKYEEMKAVIDGGYLETVPYFDTLLDKPCVAFCDEEGKLKGLRLNFRATRYLQAAMATFGGAKLGDVLVGPVVIVCADTVEELGAL